MGVEWESCDAIQINAKEYAKPRPGVMREVMTVRGRRYTRLQLKGMNDEDRPDFTLDEGYQKRYNERFEPLEGETLDHAFLRFQSREKFCKCGACGTFGSYAAIEGACHECGFQAPPPQVPLYVRPWDERTWEEGRALLIHPFKDEPVASVQRLVEQLTGAAQGEHDLAFEARRMDPAKTLLEYDVVDYCTVYLRRRP